MAGPNSRDILDHKRGSIMDQQLVRGQHTQPDQQADVEKKATSDLHKAAIDQHIANINAQIAAAQQRGIEQEPKSGEDTFKNQLITPEGNEAYLRQHQRLLKNSYPSLDLSEVSYHTERTDFPGSRHSSINTEPLTLDAEQIHEAKDQAVDVMQKVDSDQAFDIFTKDTLNTIIGRVSMMEYYWRDGQDFEVKGNEPSSPEAGSQVFADQLNSLVEKAQQVVDANQQQKSQKSSNVPEPDTKGQDSSAAPAEDTVKLKDD